MTCPMNCFEFNWDLVYGRNNTIIVGEAFANKPFTGFPDRMVRFFFTVNSTKAIFQRISPVFFSVAKPVLASNGSIPREGPWPFARETTKSTCSARIVHPIPTPGDRNPWTSTIPRCSLTCQRTWKSKRTFLPNIPRSWLVCARK